MSDLDAAAVRTGGCLCGAVRFEAGGNPELVAACHCDSCRRHTGAPVAVYADFLRDRIRYSGRRPAEFESSPGAWRGFCGDCGSTLYFRGDARPGMIHLHIGSFDPGHGLVPVAEENVGDQLAWISVTCRST